jgi:hypothetical protein
MKTITTTCQACQDSEVDAEGWRNGNLTQFECRFQVSRALAYCVNEFRPSRDDRRNYLETQASGHPQIKTRKSDKANNKKGRMWATI